MCAGLLALVELMLAGACTSASRSSPALPEALAWPVGAQRVELVSIVHLDELPASGQSRFLGWLGGRKEPLLLERPYGVAWDGSDLLLTDPSAGRIVRLRERGRLSVSPTDGLQSPVAVAPCRGGVVVADSRAGAVLLLDRDLRAPKRLAAGLERPSGVACIGERVFVVETGRHQVVVLEPDGRETRFGRRGEGPGEFNFPVAIAAQGDTLWVGDTLNFRVQQIDAVTGRALTSFGKLGDAPGEMPRLKGVAVDATGRLWLADAVLDRVMLFDAAGAFLFDLGRPGAAPGEFSFPAGVASHPDGRVAVVDSLNRRVQIFRTLPRAGVRP